MKSLQIKLKKNQTEVDFVSLESITHLEINGENLKSFSSQFLNSLLNSNVESLSIKAQKTIEFDFLNPILSQIKTLSILKIKASCSKKIEHWPDKFTSSLKILTLQGLELITCPLFLLTQNNIVDLDLSRNKISQLPDDFIQLTNLSRLNLDQNQFSKLPLVLTKMKSINHISLDQNIFDDDEKAKIQRELNIWP